MDHATVGVDLRLEAAVLRVVEVTAEVARVLRIDAVRRVESENVVGTQRRRQRVPAAVPVTFWLSIRIMRKPLWGA